MLPFSWSCTRNRRLCSFGLVMCGGIYGYCGGSKFGRHQFPIVSSTIQSCFTPSCLPNVCNPSSKLIIKHAIPLAPTNLIIGITRTLASDYLNMLQIDLCSLQIYNNSKLCNSVAEEEDQVKDRNTSPFTILLITLEDLEIHIFHFWFGNGNKSHTVIVSQIVEIGLETPDCFTKHSGIE